MSIEINEGHFNGFDGQDLFFQVWPEPQPQALVVGVHGLGEHCESYRRLAEGLKGSGYQLCMSDLRGHGRSSGRRGVGSLDEFVQDIMIFIGEMRRLYPQLPIFILGHSLGGLVVLKTLIKHSDLNIKGVALSSPLLGVTVEIPTWKRKSAQLLSKVAPNLTLFNEIPHKNLTHDWDVVQALGQDHLRHDRISPRLFVDMLASMDFVMANAEKIRQPILIQQAGEDLVVSRPKTEAFFEKLQAPDKELIVYDGYFHEIYNELGRPRVFEELKRWFKKHLK
ncbi:MAG: lysophospholipase [Oligoflexia bacterium]|nr:lysophospholipase [Oligoflexia bacterium]